MTQPLQSMEALVISKAGPALPRETILSKVGIVGMSGSGKTQTARKVAESMLEIQQHIAVLDPTGAWWGLRSSADGLSEGYPIVVFGGEHADAPLRVDSGTMLAKALVKERFNAIFDMSKFHDGEIRRFSTDFLAEVYLRNREPLHLFLDEFDIICPQAKGANSEEARAAVNTVVRRGRLKGLGSTMITQNPQDADKSVLNMADVVIAMRTQGSQAIDAIGKWMGRNLDKQRLNELVTTLPELKTGSGFIWAPQLKVFGVEEFLLCKTYDSGKTPRLGETVKPPKVLAKIDIAKLGEKINATVKEAEESSVDHLRARVKDLEAKLAERGEPDMGMSEEIAAMERELEDLRPLRGVNADHARLMEGLQRCGEHLTRAREAFHAFEAEFHGATGVEQRPLLPASHATKVTEALFSGFPMHDSKLTPKQTVDASLRDGSWAKKEVHADPKGGTRRLTGTSLRVAVIAAGYAKQGKGIKKSILAALCGVSDGGSFSARLSEAKQAGAIEVTNGVVYGTESGSEAYFDQFKTPSTTREVLDLWLPKLGGVGKGILQTLVAQRGRGMSRGELAKHLGVVDGGSFSARVSEVRKTGLLVDAGRGMVAANKEALFL